MFEYDFLNFVYVNVDCMELEELLKKIKKATNDLEKISKAQEMIFIKILTIALNTVIISGIKYIIQFKLALAVRK